MRASELKSGAPRFRRCLVGYPLLLPSLLVAVASLRIAATYRVFSFTIDEPCHFACGLEYLSKHVYRYETQHPPLARAMIALGPYLAGVRPLGGSERNTEGRAVILQSGHPERTLALMRLGILPFYWMASWTVFLWCRHYFDNLAGLAAVALFSLLPPILAHAGMACTDMAVTACLGAAFFALAVWAELPGWKHGILLGVAAALAGLSKFTALIYLPSAAATALLLYVAAVRPSPGKIVALIRERAPTFALAALSGGLVVWASYWFSFGKVPAWNLSLPAPEFFDGLLAAQLHNQTGHPAYLLGNFSMKGWWYYFPVALAVKTPIGFLVLATIGVYACARNFSASGSRLLPAYCLGILIPAMVAGHVNIGVRLILPIYVGLSILAALGLLRLARGRAASRAFAVLLLLWIAVSGAVHHPDYLSYFNELAGREPADVLVDSDLDWGQDTKRLARRLRQLEVRDVSVMMLEPLAQPLAIESDLRRYYGLPRIKPVNVLSPAEGWNVISPTVARALGLNFKPWYERIPPTEKVGALWLYHVPEKKMTAP